jgi:hypothetical protein
MISKNLHGIIKVKILDINNKKNIIDMEEMI